MQLTPRYLLKNRTVIVANDAGFVTEYRQVYQKNLKVYRGIDNILEFQIKNADQKPINIATYTIKFQCYDENFNLVIQHDATILDASKGLCKVNVTENDLLNLRGQFLRYNIHMVDSNDDKVLTYVDEHFGNTGTIELLADAFPGPREPHDVRTFTEIEEDTWYSEAIDAQPGINGNEALHTAVFYTDSYTGNITVQATLHNQVIQGIKWSDIGTISFDGTESDPVPFNFNGVYSFLRFKTDSDPSQTISKILVKN